MPASGSPSARRVVVVTAMLGSALAVGLARSTPASGQAASSILRFHHAHYRVGDPSAATNDAARKLEGVRVIVPGLGVGVRTGREYLLFDRADDADPPVPDRSARLALALAAGRLKAWGLEIDPSAADRSRVAGVFTDLPVHHLAFTADDFTGTVQRLVDRGIPSRWRRDDSTLFDAGDGLMIEIVRDTDREDRFWCPMHPDVRSADDGRCPICGMALVPIPPPKIGEYKLDVSQVRAAGRFTGLKLAVLEPDTNAHVRTFAVVHEKLFHLFVVSRDLTFFAHVHPDLMPDGTFALTHPLPPGEYMLIADFLPAGGTTQMVQKAIIVAGRPAPGRTQDESNGLKVELRTEDLAAGRHARLVFTVSDARTGAPITDLEPYLGTPAHLLIVRADLSDAMHAHPEERETGGPTVSFHPIMPAAGNYKGWIQFQRGGQVSTTPFEFSVER